MSPPGTTPHQACFYAHELTRLGSIGEIERLGATLFDSKVDLNPHQVEAALFAISNPLQRGVLLADEVGLGKTIEAGLVLCQRWAERRQRLIVVCPAHIRKQWQQELSDKFNLPALVLDRTVWNRLVRGGLASPFDSPQIMVISYGFAARMKDDLRAVPFDLVVLDEAHKLRNAYQPSKKSGQAIRWAFELRDKILLTATPLQNSLLELYGLGWLISDEIFGDRSAFQSRYAHAGGDLSGLRQRLEQFCKRTLRRDCGYIPYTKRHAMTHPFTQTVEERALHRDVMDFMSREISFAFPVRQRQLIEMILFKTLASSPMALASTLRTMRERLIALRDGLDHLDEDALAEALGQDEDFDIEVMLEEFDPNAESDAPAEAVQGRLLAQELEQLDALIARAERISVDSKSVALLRALEAGFERMREIGARQKALIFTESRKTQAFLASYLEANGYAGRVITFNGSNSHPAAKSAYEAFIRKYAGTDRITGSRPIDMRSALIEAFREDGQILLATEAAAEGINLQFCSLVVNYDLPWNPQRIEQRIGRCHRYGQKHDVIVVNFLSQGNIADRRVHDLLQQKFNLFDGLFGASDEVLGAIEDGVDFEKRVHSILKSCRNDAEIEQAFDALQEELQDTIAKRMDDAKKALFEHFDADVHERLKINRHDARLVLDRVGERFWKLAHWGLDGRAEFDDASLGLTLSDPPQPHIPSGAYRLMSAARADDQLVETDAHLLRLSSPLGEWLIDHAKSTQLPTSTLRFDISDHPRKVSVLTPLVGQGGWLRLEKLALESDAREEFLLLTTITDAGENLDQETAQRLLDVSASTSSGHFPMLDAAIASRLDADAEAVAHATLSRASDASNARFRQMQAQINAWAEDKIAAAEGELERTRQQLKAARRAADMAETMQARSDASERIAALERQQRRQRKAIFEVEDEVEAKRKEYLASLRARISQRADRERLFTIRWEAV
ncbi:MAG: SNF2-related protein [Phycisphaerales bacterium]